MDLVGQSNEYGPLKDENIVIFKIQSNVRHVARGHMETTALGHGHLASCHVASCHLDKTVKCDILAPLELNMLIILQMHVLLCDTVVCCINLL